jgi:hypothetical protein
VVKMSYRMVKTFFFLSESRQKQGRQESKQAKCVVKMSYHMVKTFFFLSESRQKQGRQESKAGRNRTKSQRSGFVFLRYLKSVRLVRNTGQTEAKFQRQA